MRLIFSAGQDLLREVALKSGLNKRDIETVEQGEV
jgi:hypothetical protein